MRQVDELFQQLRKAPLRSAELVKRVALEQQPLEALARLYGVDVPRAETLVFRAFLDVESGGTARSDDASEGVEVAAFFGRGQAPRATALLALKDRLEAHRAELSQAFEAAARAWDTSPARARDEWLRRLAIVVVVALSAYFYWREKTKPPRPPERRPLLTPQPKD